VKRYLLNLLSVLGLQMRDDVLPRQQFSRLLARIDVNRMSVEANRTLRHVVHVLAFSQALDFQTGDQIG